MSRHHAAVRVSFGEKALALVTLPADLRSLVISRVEPVTGAAWAGQSRWMASIANQHTSQRAKADKSRNLHEQNRAHEGVHG